MQIFYDVEYRYTSGTATAVDYPTEQYQCDALGNIVPR